MTALQPEKPGFRTEAVSRLLGQAYALGGSHDAARAAYAEAVTRLGSLESRIEYAIWAAGQGDAAEVERQQAQIEMEKKHWKSHQFGFYKDALKRLDEAVKAMARRG